MGKVIILFGFCTAGKSTILKYLKEQFKANNIQILDIDTDKKISERKYNGHIYNIYQSLYKERGDGKENIKDALNYIEKKERELLVKLTDECPKSTIPCIIAPGPFLVIREPEWSDFYKKVNPICYYLELTPEEVYDGLMDRRKRLESNEEISKLPSFGCWDYCVITEFKNGRYELLKPKIALENIKKIMLGPRSPIKIFKNLSNIRSDKNRIFKAREIRNDRKDNLKDKLYNSIKNDLL